MALLFLKMSVQLLRIPHIQILGLEGITGAKRTIQFDSHLAEAELQILPLDIRLS
jgi:hypothetical protein